MKNFRNILNKKGMLLILSVGINALLFLLDFAFYNPVFATNDDYRMSLIVSGAYTGVPSDTLIFMKYPLALLLSGLYKITANIAWYGIGTMLCIFVPSCLILYYILREAEKKNHMLLGMLVYALLYAFIIQKHAILPQFTLTAAFMGVAALLLLWFMPDEKYIPHIVFSGLFAVISFSIRMKVFFMLVPFIILIIVLKLISKKKELVRHIPKYAVSVVTILMLCLGVQLVDTLANPLGTEYMKFNTARSLVYDFGELPSYTLNDEFYRSNGISEQMYYDISARYLDLNSDLSTENLHSVSDYLNQAKNKTPFFERLGSAFVQVFSQMIDSKVIYQFLFAFILSVIAICIVCRRKLYSLLAMIIGAWAGFFCEMTYLCYIARVMNRLTEVFIFAVAVIATFVLMKSLLPKDEPKVIMKSAKKYYGIIFRNGVCIVGGVIVGLGLFIANQSSVTASSVNQNNINIRLEVLNTLASNNRENFYFYDAYDFIAASSDVFATYDDIVNTDSLGNWYVNSKDYIERNKLFGFEHSADGLTDGSKNTYFVAIGNMKNGMLYTLKEKYNMELILLTSVPYYNNNLNIYEAVPCMPEAVWNGK